MNGVYVTFFLLKLLIAQKSSSHLFTNCIQLSLSFFQDQFQRNADVIC